jgi:hypothetical protein
LTIPDFTTVIKEKQKNIDDVVTFHRNSQPVILSLLKCE